MVKRENLVPMSAKFLNINPYSFLNINPYSKLFQSSGFAQVRENLGEFPPGQGILIFDQKSGNISRTTLGKDSVFAEKWEA